MEDPFINTIDEDFIQQIQEDEIIDDTVYPVDIFIDDKFIIDINSILFIGVLNRINLDENQINLQNEDGENLELKINIDKHILLKTDKYVINDIEKIININEDEFDEIIEIQLKKDIYPELNLEVQLVETDKFVYTKTQKKEILLASLVQSFNIYDDLKKTKEFIEIIDNIVELEDIETINTQYLKHFYDTKTLPNWLLPISENYKRKYADDDDDDINKEINEEEIEYPFVITNFDKEYEKLYNINKNSKLNYINLIKQQFANEYYPTRFINRSTGYKTNYEGKFLLNAKVFKIDNRKTLNENYTTSSGYKSVLINKEQHLINSLILFPNLLFDLNYNLTLNNKSIPLYFKIILNSKLNKSNSYDKLTKILSDSIVNNIHSEIINYDNNKIINYEINKDTDSDILFDLLNKNLPSITNIITNINIPVFNYNDLIKYLIQYNIKLDDFKQSDRNFANKIIKNYIKKIQSIPLKLNKIIKVNRSNIENINLILEYIFKQSNINIQNYYLKKFINKFTKEIPESNWLTSIHTNEKILCKHYVLSSKLIENPELFDTLKTEYGTEPVDGVIYCKNCHHKLTIEDFSIFEGFEEDKPIITKAILEKDEVDIYTELTPKQLENVKLITYISNSMGINLIKSDIYDIIKLYELVNNDNLSDERYKLKNVSTISHPLIKQDISKNVNKPLLKKKQSIVQKYLIDSNRLIFFYLVILIHVQFSLDSYNNSIEILNKDKLNFSSITNDAINEKGIKLISQSMKKLIKQNQTNNLWKHCFIFLSEYKKNIQPKPEQQMKNVIIYLLSPYFPQIKEKITNFIDETNQFSIGFLKQTWINFRPLSTNKTIEKINEKLMDETIFNFNKPYFDIKNIAKYSLENSSLIRSINQISPYNILNIKISELLTNLSFYDIYKYSIYLYGTSNKSNYINLTIHRFLETINPKYKKEILSIFTKQGWDENLIKFKSNKIPFVNLKKCVIDIVKFYNNLDSNGIYYYNLIMFNNIKLIYFNLLPKRIYNHLDNTIDDIFPTINEDDLLKKIKHKYCYDKYGTIIYNDKIYKSLLHIDFNFNKLYYDCNSNIDNDNLWEIIDIIYKQNKLEPIYFKYKYDNYDSKQRLIYFLTKNKQLFVDKNFNELYNISIKDITDQTDKDLLSKSYELIQSNTKINTIKIKDFIKSSEYLTDILKENKLNEKIFGLNFSLIDDIFYNSQTSKLRTLNSYDIDYFINFIFMTTSIIKNNTLQTENIPKWWNQTDYKNLLMNEFINKKELAIYNDVYVPKKEINSFDKYKKYSVYFDGFINYIKPYKNKLMILKGINNTEFTKNRELRIKKFLLSFIFIKMIEYIELLSDVDSDIHMEQNMKYEQLESEDFDIFNCIEILSRYTIELFINIIQEFTDLSWFLNINDLFLSEKLSAQSEREKQLLLQRLDIMDPIQRKIALEMQNIGASNWYKELDETTMSYINSEDFVEKDKDEKTSFLNSFYKNIDEGVNSISVTTGVDDFDTELNLINQEPIDNGYYNTHEILEEGEGEEGIDLDYGDM